MIGINVVTVGGKERGFKFGTMALAITCKLENCSLRELGERMATDKEANLETIINVLYGAASSYCKSMKLTIDFDTVDVADWIDELGLERGLSILSDGMKVHESKNGEAPTK